MATFRSPSLTSTSTGLTPRPGGRQPEEGRLRSSGGARLLHCLSIRRAGAAVKRLGRDKYGVPNGASLVATLWADSTCSTGMTIQVTAAVRTTALRNHGSRSGERILLAPGYLFGVRKRHYMVSPELPELPSPELPAERQRGEAVAPARVAAGSRTACRSQAQCLGVAVTCP